MNRLFRLPLVFAVLCIGFGRVSAQETNALPYSGPLVASAMLQTLNRGEGFEGEFTFEQTAEDGKSDTVPVTLAAKGPKLFCEINIAGGSSVRNEASRRMLQKLGMDRIGLIHEFGQPTCTLLVPTLKAAVDLPLPEEIGKELAHYRGIAGKLRKAGSEVVEGVEFRKILIPDSANSPDLAWLQTDRNDFPALVEGFNPAKKEKLLLRTVSLLRTPPVDARFAIPAGFKKYDSLKDLQAVTARRIGLPSARPR